MLRPGGGLASRPGPAPLGAAETFTSELSPPGSPRGEVGYDYAANWNCAARGLSPTRRVLLRAASSAHGIEPETSSGPGDGGGLTVGLIGPTIRAMKIAARPAP